MFMLYTLIGGEGKCPITFLNLGANVLLCKLLGGADLFS